MNIKAQLVELRKL